MPNFRCLLAAIVALTGARAFAFGLATGGAAVDTGDNRLIPGALASVQWSKDVVTDVLYYGQENASFQDRYLVATCEWRWPTGIGALEAGTGLAAMAERITVNRTGSTAPGAVDKSADLPKNPGDQAPTNRYTRNNFNGAGVLGLHYRIGFPSLWTEASWSSQIYPAGGQFFLMASDVHEVFSLTFGVSL